MISCVSYNPIIIPFPEVPLLPMIDFEEGENGEGILEKGEVKLLHIYFIKIEAYKKKVEAIFEYYKGVNE